MRSLFFFLFGYFPSTFALIRSQASLKRLCGGHQPAQSSYHRPLLVKAPARARWRMFLSAYLKLLSSTSLADELVCQTHPDEINGDAG